MSKCAKCGSAKELIEVPVRYGMMGSKVRYELRCYDCRRESE